VIEGQPPNYQQGLLYLHQPFCKYIGRIETYMLNLKPIKRTLRNAGFVLDDFATHIDKKQLSFRHPYIYTGMAIAAVGVMIANKYYGFGLY